MARVLLNVAPGLRAIGTQTRYSEEAISDLSPWSAKLRGFSLSLRARVYFCPRSSVQAGRSSECLRPAGVLWPVGWLQDWALAGD